MEPTTPVTNKARTKREQTNGKSLSGNGKRYSDADKLRAVIAMLAQNREHPFSDASLSAARVEMGFAVPISTLREWHTSLHDKALAAIPQISDTTLAETTITNMLVSLLGIQSKLVNRINNQSVIDDAPLRDLMVGLGIVIDKLQRIAGIDTSTTVLVKQLDALCARMGVPIDDVLSDVIGAARTRLDDEAAARRPRARDSGTMLAAGDTAIDETSDIAST